MAKSDVDIDFAPFIKSSGVGRKKNNPWFETDIVWGNVLLLGSLHILALYAAPLFILFRIKWQTWLFTVLLHYLAIAGIVVGTHRLFAHKAFKATTPLKIFLLLGNSVTGQHSVWRWARDHRVHHKHADTVADPHNSRRGFFYSHLGWFMLRRHPATVEKWKTVDMSDLNNDPYVMFQKKHEFKLFLVFGVMIPIILPVFGWNESILNSFLVPGVLRMVYDWNTNALVNSWCHFFGTKPYDKTIYPTQSAIVSHLTLGEGWHNYHHAFPWDYRTSELGLHFNPMTTFIDVCARLGLAYDLRKATDDLIKAKMERTGDGTLSR